MAKQNAKEKRAAAQAEKMKKIQQANAAREKKAEEERIKAEAERIEKEAARKKEQMLKKFKLDQDTRNKQDKSERKSLAKASGLKSTFAVGNELYMTSFGKGNDAVVEKRIADNSVTKISADRETFLVDESSITKMTVPIQSKRISVLSSTADNPLYRKDKKSGVQPDKLLLKDTLEKIYFGKTFDDTLHIQIIYNILDIEKILTVHSVNTVYALNNLFGEENAERGDFIGRLTFQNTYDEFISNQKNQELLDKFYSLNSLGYYGNVFFKDNKKRSKKEIYDILALTATIRQWCVHCEEDKRTWIYNAESVLNQEYLDILDDVYSSIILKVNQNFIKDNKVNLVLLSDILDMRSDDDFKELIRQYYRFIITKEQKLLGFSLTKVREYMLEDTVLKSTDYDSVRSKLYKLIDFTLFSKYTTDENEKQNALHLVESLRTSLSDEMKENIYKTEARRLWEKYEDTIMNRIAPGVDEKTISALKKDKTYDNIMIDDIVKEETSDITCFSKIIYLLNQFIDGKEVNDLTTTLINKFDNIRSFTDTAEQIGLECKFTDEYSFFNKSETVKKELHVIKNLTGMKYYDLSIKHQMYRDAIDILGIRENLSDTEINSMIDKILFIGPDGKPIKTAKGQKGFRNFIISNIIESSRFRYLVKYCNPKKIRKIADNKQIVKFVLGRITETQIERYYRSCNPELKKSAYPGREAAVNDLAEIIADMKFDDFKDVKQDVNANGNSEDAQEKMKYQTIISLYLTVCYHLVKNLVNINARYVMAFHSLERDARLYGIYNSEADYQDKLSKEQSVLLEKLLSDSYETAGNLHLRNKKWNMIMRENLMNYSAEASQNFRNGAAHLNPIRNADIFISDIEHVTSYFDIYHYIIQKSVLCRIQNKTAKLSEYENNINKYHSYCKDFVKALCVPFGYNVVRFKSLSIYEMFDRNYAEEKRAENK